MQETATMAKSTNDVYESARAHFDEWLEAALFHLIFYLQSYPEPEGNASATIRKFPFLLKPFQSVTSRFSKDIRWESALRQLDAGIVRRSAQGAVFLPLNAFRKAVKLSLKEILALLLIGLVEDEPELAAVYAFCHGKPNRQRPTVALLNRIFSAGAAGPALNWDGLFKSGILEVFNPAAPRSEWELRIPPTIWDLLKGEVERAIPEYLSFTDRRRAEAIDGLMLPEELRRRLRRLAGLLQAGQVQTVVIRGTPGSDRLAVAQSLAAAAGYHLVLMNPGEKAHPLTGQICVFTCALPAMVFDLAPSEVAEFPRLEVFRGPRIIVLGAYGSANAAGMENSITIQLPPLSLALRRQVWQQAFGKAKVEDPERIARRFFLPANYIRQVARQAINEARLENAAVAIGHVRRASRSLNRQALEKLAQRLNPLENGQDIIVGHQTRDSLDELLQRCEQREQLPERVGTVFTGNLSTGVRALFRGPSGTGKTLSARIVAQALELDVYRVDLSAVVNKYIGETEKNLNEIFSTAEELDVILLLDEGDALLSSRTQVKSSNDRYANLETNFLLQRLENYRGIVFITTNAGDNIDSAFKRRIDVDVTFFLPEREERRQIWELHLPADHEIDAALLDNLAGRCILSGGQIRNAVLFAASLALSGAGGRLAGRQVLAGVANEYRKAGSVSPLGDPSAPEQNNDPLQRLAAVLR